MMQTLPQSLFHNAALENAEHLALVSHKEAITFGELLLFCRRSSANLLSLSSDYQSPIIVAIGKSVLAVKWKLACMYAGLPYVYLDPMIPHERKRTILTDVNAQIVISDEPIEWEGWGGTVLEAIADCQVSEPLSAPREANPLAISHIAFTSGSTGKPKGVMIPYDAELTFIQSIAQIQSGKTRICVNANFSFDASLQQVLRIALGHTIFVVSEEEKRDPFELKDFLVNYSITDLDMTPSHLAALLEFEDFFDELEGITIWLGGEKIPAYLDDKVRGLMQSHRLRFVNVYGLTESTIDNLYTESAGSSDSIRSLKCSFSHSECYVLDDQLKPAEEGTLFISGRQLSLGYWGQPGLTAARFIPCPFSFGGKVMLNSGDLARHSRNGDIDIIGREDGQVKVNGFRVELDEIETSLVQSELCTNAVVYLNEQWGLTAVGVFENDTSKAHIMNTLGRLLPSYMVPNKYFTMARLPTTVSGKLNRSQITNLTKEIEELK